MCRLCSFVLGVIAATLVLFGTSVYMQKMASSTNQSDRLVIYNWKDYTDPDLITKLTDEIGIEVQYETFDSNESVYTKIKQGRTTYDIAVPLDHMTDKMREENLLIKLDKPKVTGSENISSELLGLSLNENSDYSIPYFWETLGIVYNGTMVRNTSEHWSNLWNLKYADDIMLVDGACEVMGIGLRTSGYSFNTKSLSELNAASQKLDNLTPNTEAIIGDEMKGYMINSDAAIGVIFFDEASEILDSSKHLHYVAPNEGSDLWSDGLVIPRVVKHIDETYTLISFMSRPENVVQSAECTDYSTPNDAVKELLLDDVKDGQAFCLSEEAIKNLEVHDNLG